MPSTPIYGIPYPALGDPPNGPAQLQALATEVEVELNRIDVAASSLTARVTALEGQPGPRGIIGGQAITGTNTLTATITTTETMPTNMHSGSQSLAASRRYEIYVRFKVTSTVTGDVFVLRVREGASAGTSGNQIREYVHRISDNTLGFTEEFTTEFETGGSPISKFFSLTAVRIAGTGSLTFIGGGATSTNLVGVWVTDVGPSGRLTSVAS